MALRSSCDLPLVLHEHGRLHGGLETRSGPDDCVKLWASHSPDLMEEGLCDPVYSRWRDRAHQRLSRASHPLRRAAEHYFGPSRGDDGSKQEIMTEFRAVIGGEDGEPVWAGGGPTASAWKRIRAKSRKSKRPRASAFLGCATTPKPPRGGPR